MYARTETRLLGEPVRVRVIGASHDVVAPTLAYRETLACRGLPDGGRRHTVDLAGGAVDDSFTYRGPAVCATLRVTTCPLSAFDPTAAYDLHHRFAPDAHTAIRVTDAGYRTHHTYPEFDVDVVTRTRLRPRGDATSETRTVESPAPEHRSDPIDAPTDPENP